MLQELIYTSAPKGLKPGSQGFCTVAASQGLPPNLAARLEALSGYRHVFSPQDQNASFNPVTCSYLRLKISGAGYHILSRVADAGLDYSKRTNKIAHHFVLEQEDIPPQGPAAILAMTDNFVTNWNDRKPELIAHSKPLRALDAGVVSVHGV